MVQFIRNIRSLIKDKYLKKRFFGTWMLVSMTRKLISTGEIFEDFGSDPDGFLYYSHDGRMMVFITKKNRPKPISPIATSEEAALLFNTMIGYTGTYAIHDNQVIHHVNSSWNEEWSGTDQARYYKFSDDLLTLTTGLFSHPVAGQMEVILVWKKIRKSQTGSCQKMI